MSQNRPSQQFRVDTIIRLLAIIESHDDLGVPEVPSAAIHSVAYFADALAPVYDLPILYPNLLKRDRPARVPEIQYHLDRLVGIGVLAISDLEYEFGTAIDFRARYALNRQLADPILEAMRRRKRTREEVEYVHELTLALSGLGPSVLRRAVEADATYGDPNSDQGTVVELLPLGKPGSRAVQFAKGFRSLSSGSPLSPSELVNLYVRHLYGIVSEEGL